MAAFMKLGDIKGEVVSSGLRGQGSSGDTVTGGDGTDLIGSNGESGFASWQDRRDHNLGNRSNWDAICDVGTAIKQTSAAEALTNYRPEGIGLDHPVFEDGALERRFGGGSNAHALTQKVQHGCFEIQSCFSTEKLDLRSDIRFVIEPVNLVQGLDAAGLNNPEGIGLDHPIFDVVNKVVSSLQPANEFI